MTVAITGYPSSGKSVARRIADEIGYKTVEMGDHVRRKTEQEYGERLQEAQMDDSSEVPSDIYAQFATQQREKHGYGVVAKWCRDEIINADKPVFIGGMRCPEERKSFEQFTEITVIFIHAPASLRLKWIQQRERDGEGEFGAAELLNRDSRENSWGVNELIQSAEYTVQNCTNLEQYKQNIRQLLTKLID